MTIFSVCDLSNPGPILKQDSAWEIGEKQNRWTVGEWGKSEKSAIRGGGGGVRRLMAKLACPGVCKYCIFFVAPYCPEGKDILLQEWLTDQEFDVNCSPNEKSRINLFTVAFIFPFSTVINTITSLIRLKCSPVVALFMSWKYLKKKKVINFEEHIYNLRGVIWAFHLWLFPWPS